MTHISIICEGCCNHQGNLQKAKDLMLASVDVGADYIKFQKRCPRVLLSKEKYDAPYDSPHSFGKTYLEHREALEFSVSQWEDLFSFASNNRINLFASVFDMPSAIVMKELGMKTFKIGSGQTDKLNLIEYVASVAETVMISTGMSTINEVFRAYEASHYKAILFHTVSSYPTETKDVNLGFIKQLLNISLKNGVGFSGHNTTYDGVIEAAAIGMGVTHIEKHFCLDHGDKGSDQMLSHTPQEMCRLVNAIRDVEKAMGSGSKCVLPVEHKCRGIYRG